MRLQEWIVQKGLKVVVLFEGRDTAGKGGRRCKLPAGWCVRRSPGIVLLKYWLSVSDEEQERRFKARLNDPAKRWKLSPIDVEARARWVDYAEAKDEMFAHTDTKNSPWFVVEADDKRTARLNLISHLLEQIPYESVDAGSIEFPPRQERPYTRPPRDTQTFVPERYRVE